jgi:chitin disaccharide deacetylase
MNPNPILKKLGYSDDDKLVIIHTDDIGMCQASVQAFADLWDFGTISCGATMVPCPWFPAAAEFCRKNPEVDMGVHATLTAEWQHFRWAPISTVDRASGLFDDEGFFHHQAAPVQDGADLDFVRVEVQAQYDRAVQFGIDPTHIDAHMLTILHPRLVPAYIETATKARVPFMLPRNSAEMATWMGYETRVAEGLEEIIQQTEARGVPLVDRFDSLPLDDPNDQINLIKKILRELQPGITYLVLHPSIDTPELRAICPDWPSRVANYEAMMSREVKNFIKNEGIQVIGYKVLRDLPRGE